MLASLNENGKLAVVVPHGVLFRAGTEGAIRKALIEHDLVEGVIGLAPNLFYGAGIPAAILFLRKKKPAHMQGRVMILNGAEQFESGRAQNYLRDNHIDALNQAYLAFEDVDRLAKVVDTDELAEHDYSLNISRYVNLGEEAEVIDVAAEVENLSALIAERDAAEVKMSNFLKELGYAG
jgi:type I restriction enzyme M protein